MPAVLVTTPENVVVSYRLASVASRFLALLVDLVIQFSLILLIQWVIRFFGGIAGLGSLASAFGIVFVNIVLFAYAIIFEMLWAGRTPGKRLFGLRVVRDGGYPINLAASATRNILRFLDFGIFPLGSTGVVMAGVPGVIAIFLSGNGKRMGDIAAGTIVVQERAYEAAAARKSETTPALEWMLDQLVNLDRVSNPELQLIRRLLSRSATLTPYSLERLATKLADPLLKKLGMNLTDDLPATKILFLQAIDLKLSEERGIL